MTKAEFIERTGFEPTDEEYAEIEEIYYNFDGDKDAFCKDFSKNGIFEMVKARKEHIERLQFKVGQLQFKVEHLQSELDKELEWKPCTTAGTTLGQDRYERLEKSGRVLTVGEAKQIIYDEFGFDSDKVTIVSTVSAFEVNRHHRIRETETFERKALYDSTDYNYIRFDCANRLYEMVNGKLKGYYC